MLHIVRYDWDYSKFEMGIRDHTSTRALMENVAKELNIIDQVGWYDITPYALRSSKSGSLLEKYDLFKLLTEVYPEYPN